jgi:hypothetical protein
LSKSSDAVLELKTARVRAKRTLLPYKRQPRQRIKPANRLAAAVFGVLTVLF